MFETEPQPPTNFRESFRWRVRLSDKAPEKLVGVAAAALAAGLIGWFGFKSPILGIAGFAIILGSTAEFWLGTWFTVDEKGASARTGLSLSAIEWTDVKRVVRDKGGVRLSPLAQPGRMDAFRGVYLRYGVANREDVERAIESFGGIRTAMERGTDEVSDRDSRREGGAGDLPPEAPNPGNSNAGTE